MKIAISTIVDYDNYGNRLQNYALQEVLKKEGHEVVTVKNYYKQELSILGKIQNALSEGTLTEKVYKKILNKLSATSRKKSQEQNLLNLKREENFLNFTKKYIAETEYSIDQNTKDFSFFYQYDLFVIGSDQVWNYNFNRFSEYDFVSYTDKPKISYAASFGVSEVNEDFQELFKQGLNSLDYISVREEAGKDIIKRLTNKDVDVVLDPTLLLSKEDWLEITTDNLKIDKKFFLTYFLDKPSEKTKLYIEEYAKKNNCLIKNLADRTDRELWCEDPAGFVSLFSQAQAVFTDSFHACVFSIIFEKEFEVFDRNTELPTMNSRIDTLLGDFDLKNRWHRDSEVVFNRINYEKVNKLVEIRKSESLKYLRNSLMAINNK
jgi:hypothetical protein